MFRSRLYVVCALSRIDLRFERGTTEEKKGLSRISGQISYFPYTPKVLNPING